MEHNYTATYKDLIVWQKAVELVVAVYALTDTFPSFDELYGLISQMRRAAVSIPSNIAEGRRRGSRKDYRKFLLNAFGSGAELETQVEISKRLRFGRGETYPEIDSLLNEIMQMLNHMTTSLLPLGLEPTSYNLSPTS